MRPVAFVLCLFALSTFGGCISYEEEIWIAGDGTGRLHATIIFSQKVTQLVRDSTSGIPTPEDIQKRCERSEGVELDTVSSYVKDGKMHLTMEMRFANFAALKKLQGKGQQNNANLFGDVLISRSDNGHIEFRRNVQVGKSDNNSSDDIFSQQLMRALLAGDTWKYTIYFPTSIVASNAQDWDPESRRASWQFDLVDLSEKPGSMRATLAPSPLDEALLKLFGHSE
ncbi:MAG: hypothetical protein ACI906_005162 [Candidatus Latescibacterota bacterium]|jgi:hypothetical protein